MSEIPETWNLSEAVHLAKQIEAIAPRFGAHVALTGGCLYKDGERKDVDFLFYRIRQQSEIDEVGLLTALEKECNIVVVRHCGWVTKAKYMNRDPMDLLFPHRTAEYGYSNLPALETGGSF